MSDSEHAPSGGPPLALWVVLAVTHAAAFYAGGVLDGDWVWGLALLATGAALVAGVVTIGQQR